MPTKRWNVVIGVLMSAAMLDGSAAAQAPAPPGQCDPGPCMPRPPSPPTPAPPPRPQPSGNLSEPNGLAFRDPYLYVANSGRNEILVLKERLDPKSHLVAELIAVGKIEQEIDRPTRLAFDAQGRLFVANAASSAVTAYRVPRWVTTATPAARPRECPAIDRGLRRPLGIAFDSVSGRVYVADNAGNDVSLFEPAGKGFIRIGGAIVRDGAGTALLAPGALATWERGDRRYVLLGLGPTASTNYLLGYRAPLNADSRPVFALSNAAGCDSGPSGPTGIAVTGGNRPLLLVTEYYASRVSAYDLHALLDGTVGSALCRTPVAVSTPRSAVAQPEGIAIDNAGNVFVANAGSNSITVYAGARGLGDQPEYTYR